MSAWPEKFVIGLTGNIATGKSVVRQMLEELGAFGIDADALAHQVISKGEALAYQQVVNTFGGNILDPDGEIERPKLARIVFADPAALARLEALIHPEVRKLVDSLIRQAVQPVVVIEAIKLIESGYPQWCDSIWVTVADIDQQLKRLTGQRGMSENLARQRIDVQAAQNIKIAAADIVIMNNGTLEDTRRHVQANWQILFSANDLGPDAGV